MAAAASMAAHFQPYMSTAASLAGTAMLARGILRELLPAEARRLLAMAAEYLRSKLFPSAMAKRHTIVVEEDDVYDWAASGSSFRHDISRGGRQRAAGTCYVKSLYEAVETYLAVTMDPNELPRLKAAIASGSASGRILTAMTPGQQVLDEHGGVEFTWTLCRHDNSSSPSPSPSPWGTRSVSFYELSFDCRYKDHALQSYLPHVVDAANAVKCADRPLKIFMGEGRGWRAVLHNSPATFDTLAMEPELKEKIVADLSRFVQRRAYYRRIGKAWKRGYLLYGPPGTGKSSLVAAMANYLKFDIYTLDLTAYPCNAALQAALIEMKNKSILVIEDIDCSADITRRRSIKIKRLEIAGEGDGWESDGGAAGAMGPSTSTNEKVTLSGLLNLVDGLWSSTGEERLIVFTTNYADRLDPALLRPGRMDMHVYMGYCCWEAFKTLVANYFGVDDHRLFPAVEELLKGGAMATPAEVAEMMLRSEHADVALEGVVELLAAKKAAAAAAEDAGVEAM